MTDDRPPSGADPPPKRTALHVLIDRELAARPAPVTTVLDIIWKTGNYGLASARIYALTEIYVTPASLRNWHNASLAA